MDDGHSDDGSAVWLREDVHVRVSQETLAGRWDDRVLRVAHRLAADFGAASTKDLPHP